VNAVTNPKPLARALKRGPDLVPPIAMMACVEARSGTASDQVVVLGAARPRPRREEIHTWNWRAMPIQLTPYLKRDLTLIEMTSR
jgi:hypothetical protein